MKQETNSKKDQRSKMGSNCTSFKDDELTAALMSYERITMSPHFIVPNVLNDYC